MDGEVELPERCRPCRGGEPLRAERARELARRFPNWELDGSVLRRRYQLRDFAQAMAWLNRVAVVAEAQGHHPDLHLTRWRSVELVLWTHAVGGLHENDFVLARELDRAWAAFEKSPEARGKPEMG